MKAWVGLLAPSHTRVKSALSLSLAIFAISVRKFFSAAACMFALARQTEALPKVNWLISLSLFDICILSAAWRRQSDATVFRFLFENNPKYVVDSVKARTSTLV